MGSTFVGSYIWSFVWCSILLFSLNISWQVFFLFYSIFYLAILLTHYLNILVFLLLGRWEPLIVVDLPGFWKGLDSTSPLSSSLECLLTSNIWNVIDRLSYYKLNIAPYRDLKMIKNPSYIIFILSDVTYLHQPHHLGMRVRCESGNRRVPNVLIMVG